MSASKIMLEATSKSASRASSAKPLRPLVLAGPSGVGKSTLVKLLQKEFPGCFGFSVSHTTRSPRQGEQDGVDYHFIEKSNFDELVKQNDFIEHAQYGPNSYGTSKKSVKAVTDAGAMCILDIDCQGVRNLKTTDLNPRYVFISPPSVDHLRKRLEGRGTETTESLARRLNAAGAEMEYSKTPGAFDAVIVNDNLDKAYETLRNLISEDVKRAKPKA